MGRSYKNEFDTFGEFLVAVYKAGSGEGDPREPNDPRLEMQSAITGLGTKVPSDGGYLLSENFADNIWTAVYSTGEIIGRCSRQIVTNNDGVSIPAIDESSRATGSRYGGLRTYWADEADTADEIRPRVEQQGDLPGDVRCGHARAMKDLVISTAHARPDADPRCGYIGLDPAAPVHHHGTARAELGDVIVGVRGAYRDRGFVDCGRLVDRAAVIS